MSDSSVSVRNSRNIKVSLQARALLELAKSHWGDSHDYRYQDTTMIIIHRKLVVERISKKFSGRLPKILMEQLVQAVLLIQRGHHEALICTKRHRYHEFRHLSPDPLTIYSYSPKNFIDPSGHFNDLAWARSFVGDENQPVLCRFELACFYCFEETITNLWHSRFSNGRPPYQGDYTTICERYSLFVAMWVCWLDDRFDQVVDDEVLFAEGFYEGGFKMSMEGSNEYGAKYFWNKCSDQEKADLLENHIKDYAFYGNLSLSASRGHAGYVHFIYSLLNAEEKRTLFATSFNNEDPHIYSCLLLSPYYESVLNYIITFPFASTTKTYASLLTELSETLRKMAVPDYKMILEALWNPLSQEDKWGVLEMESLFLRHLTHVMDMDLLQSVIQPLPHALKRDMLLRDRKSAGISALDLICEAGDYNAMHRYLLLFLVDRDLATGGLRLNSEANDLLRAFVVGHGFLLWFTEILAESERQEVGAVLLSLRGSLNVLHDLLDRVEGSDGTRAAGGIREDAPETPKRLTGGDSTKRTSRREQQECTVF